MCPARAGYTVRFMRKISVIGSLAVVGLMVLLHPGCADRVTGDMRDNVPPQTRIWVDTLGVAQTSRVHLFWSGDDPDGFVVGYFVTVDSTWGYTTSQDSVFLIPLGGLDTLIARFRVAAADDGGDGVWNSEIHAGGLSFGPEPYDDLDQSGMYSPGETFVDIGLVDPDPPYLSITIKNTPPVAAFASRTEIPSSTLPAASFFLDGTDLDGNETIERYRISLNQPDPNGPGWVELAPSAALFTLVGNLDEAGDTISASVYGGSDLADLGLSIPGMRLDQPNVLYVYCEDLSGARSEVNRMPDTSATWVIRRPQASRRMLLVNDFGGATPDPQTVFLNALSASDDGAGGTYSDTDVLNLITSPVPAPIHRPMLLATFRLYASVFWFAKIPNLNYAQNTLPSYMQSGGKVLFATGFQNFIDPQGLPIDFMPIDSLITSYTDSLGNTRYGYISRVYLNSAVIPSDTSAYPTLVFDRTAIFGSYAVVEAPGQEVVYRLDVAKNPPNTLEIWSGTPAVGVLSAQRNMFLMVVPLHLLNTVDPFGKNRLVSFMESVFRDEFGL